MSGHDDFDFEPVPGLPGYLPPGEEMLWQGRPAALPLARDAYKLTWIGAYFAALLAFKAGPALATGGVAYAFAIGLPYLGLALLGLGIVFALAWVQARSTLYTITTARVVMRIGAALPVTFNLPFAQIASASLARRSGGTGTIALALLGSSRISPLVAWPHVRPWRLARPEPALRCIPDAERVARLLAEAAETRLSMPVIRRTDAAAAAVAAE
jgi:hypothetical protein